MVFGQLRQRWQVRQHALAAAAYLVIAIVQTWPLATQLSRVMPGDLGDPLLNTWILWWNAHAVPLTRTWMDAPMFFPTRGAMAFSETLLGASLFASPMQWVGCSPLAAYNLLFLLSFPLSAIAAYALAWSLTRQPGPAFVAGLLYGFAIFRFGHLGHLQILWSWWMPLALLGLHRWRTDRRAAGLWLFAIAWLGESLSNGYYFLYFSILIALWIAWFTPWRDRLAMRRMLLPLLAAWMVAMVCFAPVPLMYARVQQEYRFGRGYGEIAGPRNSADATDFFRRSSITRIGAAILPIMPADATDRSEREVSFGLIGTLALLGAIVMVARSRRDRRLLAFYAIATIVAMVLAMGPRPRLFGTELLQSGPYAWLMAIVPGFTGVRVPARFALIATLCLAIAAALVLARLRPRTASRERMLCAAVAMLALIETWPRSIPQHALPPLIESHALSPGRDAVLELPLGGFQEFAALYRAMYHGRPLVNGTSGYMPVSYLTLMQCLDAERAECLVPVRRAGAVDIVIDRQRDAGGGTERFIAQLPDAQFRAQSRQFTVFHLPALPSSETY